MKFNLNLNFKNTSIPDMKHAKKLAAHIWEKTHIALFFFFLIVAIAIGGYIWQQKIYNGEWSPEKKQTYLNSLNSGVVFKEDDFQKVLNSIQARKDENAKKYEQLKDIFKAYK